MGFLGDTMNDTINWRFLLTITTPAIVGIFVGTRTVSNF